MEYIENPKTKDSGIICCIPQKGECPNNCEDCFFQSGRSYLEPLKDNLPNMPYVDKRSCRVVRVNDGNDSNFKRQEVLDKTSAYQFRFYNTSNPTNLEGYWEPVVLTVNPGGMTDHDAFFLEIIPKNLMFVRVRVNTWNLELVDKIVQHFSVRQVPIVLTFMAYFKVVVPELHRASYVYRKRTLNSYWAITTLAWKEIMAKYALNKWVYSCGKIEGELGTTKCRFCGNCIREFHVTKERLSEQR